MTEARGRPIQNAIFLVALLALIALAILSALFLKPPSDSEKESPSAAAPPTVVVVVVNADGTVRTISPQAETGPTAAPAPRKTEPR